MLVPSKCAYRHMKKPPCSGCIYHYPLFDICLMKGCSSRFSDVGGSDTVSISETERRRMSELEKRDFMLLPKEELVNLIAINR